MKGRASPKRSHMGDNSVMICGQLYEDLWVEEEADAKILKQGTTGFVGVTAGH